MGLADALRKVVSRVVGLDGIGTRSFLIRKKEDYDPESGPSNRKIKRIPVLLAPPQDFYVKAEGGTLVKRTKILLSMIDWAIIPAPETDTVDVGGLEQIISSVKKIEVGGKVVAYELLLGA